MIVAAVLWIAVLFVVLMVGAERFFCPALEVASNFLKLPPNVAGATLLSLGNGAPDLFTQLAAITSVRLLHRRSTNNTQPCAGLARNNTQPPQFLGLFDLNSTHKTCRSGLPYIAQGHPCLQPCAGLVPLKIVRIINPSSVGN